ncbi:MAG: hypothetical protein HYW25_00905 [Candidatus Aenigmarchaeota archaeon]|nr:hypothetical protein [Candidatus Aenigmarchaeota archaeon]
MQLNMAYSAILFVVLAAIAFVIMSNTSVLAKDKPDIYGSGIATVHASFLASELPQCSKTPSGALYRLSITVDATIEDPGKRSGDIVMLAEYPELNEIKIQPLADSVSMNDGFMQGIFRINLGGSNTPEEGNRINVAFFFSEPCTYTDTGVSTGGGFPAISLGNFINTCRDSFLGMQRIDLPAISCP